MKTRLIAVVTGSRSDYGILKPLLKALERCPEVRTAILVTGTHLVSAFGRTEREIGADGFKISARIPLGFRGDRPLDIGLAMARAMRGFSHTYSTLRPDLVVVLGDRWEVLSAAAAALPFRLPIAHLHGGESTEGLIDEQVRHAVTKLSHLHFPAAEPYRRRILAMGEAPERVFCLGAPGLDGIQKASAVSRVQLFSELRVPSGRPVGVVTYHPVTLMAHASKAETAALLSALESRPDIFWVITMPGADTECSAVMRELHAFTRRRPDIAALFQSLGRQRYLALLRHAVVMVGNSSSGIIEAPSFRLPVVNIGDRQKGRLRASNVIDVPFPTPLLIRRALSRALAATFRRSLLGLQNPYAGRSTCARIARVLATVPLDASLVLKSFHG